jgi:hypothetical protein
VIKVSKKQDIRLRLDDDDSQKLEEIKAYYNLSSYPEILRLCIGIVHRDIKEK